MKKIIKAIDEFNLVNSSLYVTIFEEMQGMEHNALFNIYLKQLDQLIRVDNQMKKFLKNITKHGRKI